MTIIQKNYYHKNLNFTISPKTVSFTNLNSVNQNSLSVSDVFVIDYFKRYYINFKCIFFYLKRNFFFKINFIWQFV